MFQQVINQVTWFALIVEKCPSCCANIESYARNAPKHLNKTVNNVALDIVSHAYNSIDFTYLFYFLLHSSAFPALVFCIRVYFSFTLEKTKMRDRKG